MDVDVDICGRQPDVDDGERVATGHEKAVVGFFDGVGQRPAAHPASVDEQRYVVAVSPRQAGVPYHAEDQRRVEDDSCVGGERQQRLRDLVTVDAGDRVAEVGVARRLESQTPVDEEHETHLGVGKRVVADDACYLRGLGGGRAQELQTRGLPAEQAPDADDRAGCHALVALLDDLPFFEAQHAARCCIRKARTGLHLGDGRYAGQRLAAEAERGDSLEVDFGQ